MANSTKNMKQITLKFDSDGRHHQQNMQFLESEESQVERKIVGLLPQLEDLGSRGKVIAEELHVLTNALKYPKSGGYDLLGSEKDHSVIESRIEEIRNELHSYADKSSLLIEELSKMLTDIREIIQFRSLILGIKAFPCGCCST